MKKMFLFLFLSAITFIAEAKDIFPNFPPVCARNLPYRSPTLRYIDYFGWPTISTGLRNQGVTLIHHNLFDRISAREELGFIGYHGSTQGFRIYQDIIRLVLQEHIKIAIGPDFHFFRIPGDPLYHYNSLTEWGSRGYDPTYFLCMNYAIYGNHTNHFSSSYYYFTVNGSANFLNYEERLRWLFQHLGIDTKEIAPLFQLSYQRIGFENGVIYQLFDTSHYSPQKPYYELADRQCIAYLSNVPFSRMVLGTSQSPFGNQIRMLLNNKYTLNPYSALVVKRYDKLPQETSEAYMQELTRQVASLTSSQELCASYRSELMQLWGHHE